MLFSYAFILAYKREVVNGISIFLSAIMDYILLLIVKLDSLVEFFSRGFTDLDIHVVFLVLALV